jgi:cytoskeletal protein RodZ
MDSRFRTALLFVVTAVVIFGAALWALGPPGRSATGASLSSASPPASPAASTASEQVTEGSEAAPVAATPSPSAEPSAQPTASSVTPTPSETSSPEPVLNALHVLCPTKGGGFAHLLLTSTTYYKAVTPEEEKLLADRYGPPVTNIDPSLLPPKSPISVTDVLSGRAQ